MEKRGVVVGAGPAGLMAAETMAAAGLRVAVYERMPSPARKLLMAGRGGLNLTHSEDIAGFLDRYGAARAWLAPVIGAFPPSALIAWAADLGQDTFVGSSGRVFPKAMKASPLLRAWLQRLAAHGVTIHTQHTWRGFDGVRPVIETPGGMRFTADADVTVLACGGASWPRLGSDAGWVPALEEVDVRVVPFRPANMGFAVRWSDVIRERFAGHPLKGAAFAFGGRVVTGEAMITGYGIEGGAIYALSAALRDALERRDGVGLGIDLRPGMTADEIARKIARTRPKDSLANRLRRSISLDPLSLALLRETAAPLPSDPLALAQAIKNIQVPLVSAQGLERAISSAGGIAADAIDAQMMLRAMPGVFVAGEMLDWEAPTGGYLLQASFATGKTAGLSAADFAKSAGRV